MAKYTTPAGDSIEPIVRELTSLREQVRDAQRPQGTRLVRSVEQVAAVRALATDAATGPVDGGRIVDATLPGGALAEGSLDDFPITGGNIQTSALPNRGTKITDAGLVSYDDDGNAIVALTGTGAAFRGDFQSGSGSSIFKATDLGIQLGDPTFEDAPFSVTAGGQMKATDATIGGTIYSEDGDKRSELSSGELIFFGDNDGYSWVSMDVDPVTNEPRLSIEAGIETGREGIRVGNQTSQIVPGTDPLNVGMKADAAEISSLYNSFLGTQEMYAGAAFSGVGTPSSTTWVHIYQGRVKFVPAGVLDTNTSNPQIAPISGGLEIKAPLVQVTGNTTVSGTLQTTGTSTLAAVNATNVTASGTLGVTGNTTLGGTLGVAGNTTLSGALALAGAFTRGGLTQRTTPGVTALAQTTGSASVPWTSSHVVITTMNSFVADGIGGLTYTSANGRYTATRAAKWLIVTNFANINGTASMGAFQADLRKNGTMVSRTDGTTPPNYGGSAKLIAVVSLAVNDYVDFTVLGLNLTAVAGVSNQIQFIEI